MKSRKEMIRDTIDDLVSEFLYYGRKEDEDLPVGAIEEAIEIGEITCAEIAARFLMKLNRSVDRNS